MSMMSLEEMKEAGMAGERLQGAADTGRSAMVRTCSYTTGRETISIKCIGRQVRYSLGYTISMYIQYVEYHLAISCYQTKC